MGNPHFWLDPDNGRRVAKAVEAKLAELSRGDAAYFAQRYADFDRRLAEGEKRWKAAMAPYKGTKIVTYHRSWPNFAEAFGLEVIGYVEPKPGIPPSTSHTIELIAEMKRQHVNVILVEPYFDLKTPQSIGRETGADVLVMPPSVGGVPQASDYLKLFDYDINLLVTTLKKVSGK
jgi:ABC-type Zn uptake system ZnuABC Zn-binding protein ZnuA